MRHNYWNNETTLTELQQVITKLGHFPTQRELTDINRNDLIHAIQRHGGLNKFRLIFNYNIIKKPNGYWTNERTVDELRHIYNDSGHFPLRKELISLNRQDLIGAIRQNGGYIKFRKLLGCNILQNLSGYWNNDIIISELRMIIRKIGDFPMQKDLINLNRTDLQNAISKHGGINKFRKLLGYTLIRRRGYWTIENTLIELKDIINNIGHFPSYNELYLMKKYGLNASIQRNGGFSKFQELCGYTISLRDIYRSKLSSYVTKRGKSSENIVKQILTDYCHIHNLSPPSYNIKLSKGNILEFICNTNKRIGIDVTNTENMACITKKWTLQTYHKHLEELWIVVFSDVFTKEDYDKFNRDSPPNVKVMSIYTFLKELDYSLSENMKNKIDKYCNCSFHIKEDIING